ncbi:MAG: hypothetical protein PW734_06140 [Verrucomicrobium sp.]|nr:hypothetical protein [Verrucomicrobium sp.]
MTRLPLDPRHAIDVPSLGFGPRWRRARFLLGELTRVRRLGFDPATPAERALHRLGLWKGPVRRLEQENRLWRALFTECQGRIGYERRRCRELLDGPVTYAHRHEYEQVLLYGEAPHDHRGLKKNSARPSRRKKKGSSWRSSWSACASWIAGFFRRERSRKPTAAPPSAETPAGCAPSSAFWIRRSRSPMRKPPAKCIPTSTNPQP